MAADDEITPVDPPQPPKPAAEVRKTDSKSVGGKGTGDDFDPVERTAQISLQIREAVRKALPAPLEQFFTVMVPGKVVNYADYSEGFDDDGNSTVPVLPSVTELNQAILCDDMPALAPVQLGPTGKSVARSYDAAISKLIPAGTTVGVDVADPKNLTAEEARYEKAMTWLLFKDPSKDSKTRVEIYSEKQEAYTKALERKTKAFNDALKRATEDPRNVTVAQQRAAYDVWVSENARAYRNLMQAAYMDWVVNGMKEEVEYWFSIVDRDSAMARVEASKEAMRAAVVQDTDGSVEYQKVRLTPANWAVIAKNKALSGKDQTRTVEWYTWEISRLQKMNAMLFALQKLKPGPTPPDPGPVDNEKLAEAMADFVEKRSAYRRTEGDSKATDEEKKAAWKAYDESRKKLYEEEAKNNQKNARATNTLNEMAQDDMYTQLRGDSGLAATMIKDNSDKIENYTVLRKALLAQQEAAGGTIVKEVSADAGVPEPLQDPMNKSVTTEPDYFTAITVEITSAKSAESSSYKSSSASFGASGGWGWWTRGSVNASYSSSASDTMSAMAKNSCRVSFECTRVDIARSWLRSELFYDADLTTGPNEFISPGFGRLVDLMESGTTKDGSVERELQRYSTFPLYPTAFLLAANVVLEISGETTEIQTHFQTESYGVSTQMTYGPFGWGGKVNASYSGTNSSSQATCEATADGCRITIKSPQIIGWVSQMVPALPRLVLDENP